MSESSVKLAGVLVPVKWDVRNHVTEVVLVTKDRHEYGVDPSSPPVRAMCRSAGEPVEVRGMLHNSGTDLICVDSFVILEEELLD